MSFTGNKYDLLQNITFTFDNLIEVRDRQGSSVTSGHQWTNRHNPVELGPAVKEKCGTPILYDELKNLLFWVSWFPLV